ncbi:MAG: DUF4491 family protein [Candidatus Hydrogenedentota bacterium]
MNFEGVILGAIAFLAIGVFHPVVIKGEYYFGARIWPIFLVLGVVCVALSLFVQNTYGSVTLGVVGFSSLWTIHEIKEQEQRVAKGWFPQNPNRKND